LLLPHFIPDIHVDGFKLTTVKTLFLNFQFYQEFKQIFSHEGKSLSELFASLGVRHTWHLSSLIFHIIIIACKTAQPNLAKIEEEVHVCTMGGTSRGPKREK
jgi:hypothetical protein